MTYAIFPTGADSGAAFCWEGKGISNWNEIYVAFDLNSIFQTSGWAGGAILPREMMVQWWLLAGWKPFFFCNTIIIHPPLVKRGTSSWDDSSSWGEEYTATVCFSVAPPAALWFCDRTPADSLSEGTTGVVGRNAGLFGSHVKCWQNVVTDFNLYSSVKRNRWRST